MILTKDMPSEDFVFLLSSDRSGSNLTLRLLDAHKEFCAPPASQLFPILSRSVSKYGDLSDNQNWSKLLENASQLHRAGFGSWESYLNLHKLLNSDAPRNVSTILKGIYHAECEAHSKLRAVIKLHKAYEYQELLLRDFPAAKYIYLVRDPRDMALSWKNTAGLRGGVLRAAKIWQNEQAGMMKFCSQIDVQDRTFRVKYEDILQDTDQTLRSICRFLNVEFDPKMLDFYQKTTNQKNAGKIDAWRNLAKPLKSENSGKFRTQLSEDEWQYIELKCKAEMKRLGYDAEITSTSTNIQDIAERLEPLEPWEKSAYAKLPVQEREQHAILRQAIERVEKG